MRNNTVYIALGSNMGAREQALTDAVHRMADTIQPKAFSNIYETPPWGFIDQPDFLNQVIRAETRLSPQDLLLELKQIESEMGREPSFRNGPRRIDLDILFYNHEIIIDDALTIPHPELVNRGFVLVPLLDIAADLVHPVENKTMREIAETVDCIGIRIYKEITNQIKE